MTDSAKILGAALSVDLAISFVAGIAFGAAIVLLAIEFFLTKRGR